MAWLRTRNTTTDASAPAAGRSPFVSGVTPVVPVTALNAMYAASTQTTCEPMLNTAMYSFLRLRISSAMNTTATTPDMSSGGSNNDAAMKNEIVAT